MNRYLKKAKILNEKLQRLVKLQKAYLLKGLKQNNMEFEKLKENNNRGDKCEQ